MNVMVSDLYDALLSAGADEAKARRASEVLVPNDTGLGPRVAGLEAGVAHLERDVSELRADMRDVRDRLARLEIKVDEKPGKGYIVASSLAVMAFIAALTAFQAQIQAFVGP